jgi:hypothetical protein
MCGQCGVILIYADDHGTLRAPTLEEAKAIMNNPPAEMRILQQARRAIIARKARQKAQRN